MLVTQSVPVHNERYDLILSSSLRGNLFFSGEERRGATRRGGSSRVFLSSSSIKGPGVAGAARVHFPTLAPAPVLTLLVFYRLVQGGNTAHGGRSFAFDKGAVLVQIVRRCFQPSLSLSLSLSHEPNPTQTKRNETERNGTERNETNASTRRRGCMNRLLRPRRFASTIPNMGRGS